MAKRHSDDVIEFMKTASQGVNGCIKQISNPKDKNIAKAMAVLIVAASVGPNAERLEEATGYERPFLGQIERNMREAELWGNMVDDRDWRDHRGDVQGETLFAHALIALGLAKRPK